MSEPQTSPREPTVAAPSGPARSGAYEAFADKIGLVPNLRLKDNALQAVACGLMAALGAGLGLILGSGLTGLLTGLVFGLLAGLFLSGGALLVIGLFRR
jgi:hypothetical protein